MPMHNDPHKNQLGMRLKQEMRKRGINSSELAREAGVLTSFIYDVVSGKSANPSTVKLAKVADVLGISLNHLVGGSNAPNTCAGQIIIPPLLTTDLSGVIPSSETVFLPTIGDISFSHELANHFLGGSSLNLRGFIVAGDSMKPSMEDGDFVIVDIGQRIPSPPAVFVLFDGGGLVIKRCEYIDGGTRIRASSDNARYGSFESAANALPIVGRVVWLAQKL